MKSGLTEHCVLNERDLVEYDVSYADVDESGSHQASFTKEEMAFINKTQEAWAEMQTLIEQRMEECK